MNHLLSILLLLLNGSVQRLALHQKNQKTDRGVFNSNFFNNPFLKQYRCLEAIIAVMEPFLDGLTACTNYKWTLLGGEPEPGDHGRLNCMR